MHIDPDFPRFVFLIIVGLSYGGGVSLVWRYRRDPPVTTFEQRRRFVIGALSGYMVVLTGVAWDVVRHQNAPLRPITVCGGIGALIVLITMYRLLHNAKDGHDDPPR